MKILVFILMYSFFVYAQDSYTLINLSPFYTYGKYSNGVYSNSKAIYSSVNLSGDLIITSGYNYISLNNNLWNYKQNSIYLSSIIKQSHLYLKFAGVFVNANYYDYLNDLLNYQDKNFSLTTELVYELDFNYLGLAYNYFNSIKGLDSLTASNISLRYDTFLNYFTYLSLRPNLYIENSGKKFLSISSKLVHWFSSDLRGNLSLTIGNRRYYFDNDLLIFYNQYDIQKLVAGIGIEFYLLKEIMISTGYQYTKFENFSINYYFIGMRTSLFF
jgi:hypothetical protein